MTMSEAIDSGRVIYPVDDKSELTGSGINEAGNNRSFVGEHIASDQVQTVEDFRAAFQALAEVLGEPAPYTCMGVARSICYGLGRQYQFLTERQIPAMAGALNRKLNAFKGGEVEDTDIQNRTARIRTFESDAALVLRLQEIAIEVHDNWACDLTQSDTDPDTGFVRERSFQVYRSPGKTAANQEPVTAAAAAAKAVIAKYITKSTADSPKELARKARVAANEAEVALFDATDASL